MKLLKRFFLLIVNHKSEPTWLEVKVNENIRLDKIRQQKHRRMIGAIENKHLMTKALKREL